MREIEFLVDGVTDGGMILGRNGSVDIPVGTVFTKVTKVRFEGRDSSPQWTDLGIVEAVSLTLTQVELYRRQIDVVPGGHTAGIRLSGDGIGAVIEVLRNKLDSEYVHLKV